MKNYRLAVDENGSPFVLNSKGSIDFGYITEEMSLPPAPIRIAEGNDKYGLCHIEMRHGDQIRDNGFASTLHFVEYVSQNFTEYVKEILIPACWKLQVEDTMKRCLSDCFKVKGIGKS